jgi:hypothetical protein
MRSGRSGLLERSAQAVDDLVDMRALSDERGLEDRAVTGPLTWQPFQNSLFCSSLPQAPGLPSLGKTSTPAIMP